MFRRIWLNSFRHKLNILFIRFTNTKLIIIFDIILKDIKGIDKFINEMIDIDANIIIAANPKHPDIGKLWNEFVVNNKIFNDILVPWYRHPKTDIKWYNDRARIIGGENTKIFKTEYKLEI